MSARNTLPRVEIILAIRLITTQVYSGTPATTTCDANASWNTRSTVTFTCTPSSGETCKDLNYSINSGTWTDINFNSGIDQSQLSGNAFFSEPTATQRTVAQQFTANKNNISTITLGKVNCSTLNSNDINYSLQADNGSNLPDGNKIVSTTFTCINNSDDYNLSLVSNLIIGNKYWIVADFNGNTNWMRGQAGGGAYLGGLLKDFYSSSWNTIMGDLYFITWYKENSKTITLTDGNNLIQYKSTDLNGNVESIKTAYHALDTVSPSSSASGCASGWNNSNQTVSITATDTTSGIQTIYLCKALIIK